MKYLLIILTLSAAFALQPALAGEATDAPAPTTQPGGAADDTAGNSGKEKKESGGKKPAAGEAEPECD